MSKQVKQPVIFVSHGAPTLPLENGHTTDFFKTLGHQFPKPSAIVCISAHWTTERVAVSTTEQNETIHDFYGFPRKLYEIQYPAPGKPELAKRVSSLLEEAGFMVDTDPQRGLDHGAWVPLSMMYPAADIPVFQLAVQPRESTVHHYNMGRALHKLRNAGVLILASGGATHNLRDFMGQSADTGGFDYAREFDRWLKIAVESGDADGILNYRQMAPEARRNHPTPEHFLPLIVALGAAGNAPQGRQIHDGFTYGMLSMAAFRWDA
ncbi:MAG: dioxygenase [Candidatus Marinimicrobia bacterium]|nr:dioxygenase [Candidatus Neomarinimicrobiota bacterium]MCF7840849.1 dioxygenase [Candidatus Neomarinimicrobiota bacterium]MCF7902747.1 dioxygenase [Candidatus Neomarinimicrobiota bacterium]